MINRPRVIVGIYAFNSEGSKVLVGKKFDQESWSLLEAKLEFGQEFDDCAMKILKKTINISIDDPKRLNFLCTYNAVDKTNKNHIVAVDYYFQLTREEEISYFKLDAFYFQKWGWCTFEELLKMQEDLFCSIKIFLRKYDINNFDDIKNLVSN